MSDELLQQAIGLIKAGKSDEARGLLYHLVKTDPRNEMAWLWLSETMNPAQKRKTLEQGLKFNPGSQKIEHALNRLPTPPKEEPRPAPPIPTPAVDRSTMQTAQLTFIEEEPEQNTPAPVKPEPKPEPPPVKIDRSLIRTGRLEMPPDELLPDNLPPELTLPDKTTAKPLPVDDRSTVQTARLEYVPDEPGPGLAPAPKPVTAPIPAQPAPVKQEKPPIQTPPPANHVDRSLLRAARIEQASETPRQTGPLPVPPPKAVTPPPKPQPETAAEPVSSLRQEMDTLLTESHPSPDPVKAQAGQPPAKPPVPPFPSTVEESFEPPRKKRRRLSGLEIALIIIALLLFIGIVAFAVWDFVLKPPVPTLLVIPTSAPVATSTLPSTNTPENTPTPIPPPTLRPTFTPLITPTATLNPAIASVLFIDPETCAVRQVSAKGGAPQMITGSTPANCVSPELAPNADKLAFRLQDVDTKTVNSLSVANADGSGQTALVEKNASPIWEVDWAPDSTWLSYTAAVGTNNANPAVGIYLIRSDGSQQTQLTSDVIPSIVTDTKDSVAWSPDGQWIAFYADNRPYIIKPDGSGAKQLSKDAGLSQIAWSPDSRQIAFYSSNIDNPGIVVVTVDGKQSFVENAALKVPVSGDALMWTPDGKQFVAYDTSQKALVLVSRDGKQVKPLVTVGGIPTRLAWSPDGTQLGYMELPQQDSPTGVLKVVNIDGTGLTTLVTSAANAPLRWSLPVTFTGTLTPTPAINIPVPEASTPSPTP